MRFAVFTHVPHFIEGKKYFAYAPYVKEMDIWFEPASKVEVVAPAQRNLLEGDQAYKREDLVFSRIPSISFLDILDSLLSLLKIPIILFRIFKAMLSADHLHIRCPGNIGLLACIVQILFPRKPKTFKYAGNWDPSSTQPLSYRFQKFLVSNPLITRNATVLVYGKWKNQSSNVLPFFTASYYKAPLPKIEKEFSEPFLFIFVGSLSVGKRPLLAIEIIQRLKESGRNVHLDIYGSGLEKNKIETYINEHHLESIIKLHGVKEACVIREAYSNSHFSILPSKSEGWPKALAEAMFHGCIPIATRISCVPWMLDEGRRGVLIKPEATTAANTINVVLENQVDLHRMSEDAMEWSQQYTIDRFQTEIKKLL